ncbi:hypothetical protein FRC00_008660 [Tulasnella sp. 408]|nr:hypothetical protein FRC00_008660 [Tulasnella sp. 408]
MRLTFLSTCLVLFGAFSQAAGAPVLGRGLEGVRPLSGSEPETWWNENHAAAAREAKRTWHAHEKGGPGKYSGEVLDKLKAAREEAVKRSESTGTNVEIPKLPVKPANAGGGSTPPGKPWKKREGEGSLDARDEDASSQEEEGGDVKPAGGGGSMPPGKGWRRHIGDARSADE